MDVAGHLLLRFQAERHGSPGVTQIVSLAYSSVTYSPNKRARLGKRWPAKYQCTKNVDGYWGYGPAAVTVLEAMDGTLIVADAVAKFGPGWSN